MNTIIDNALHLIGLRPRRTAADSALDVLKELERMKERQAEANERMRELQREVEEVQARAEAYLAEAAAAAKWDEAFARTTDAQVDKMIANAKKDVAENGTISLAEFKASP